MVRRNLAPDMAGFQQFGHKSVVLTSAIHNNFSRASVSSNTSSNRNLATLCEFAVVNALPSTHPDRSSRAKTIYLYPPDFGMCTISNPILSQTVADYVGSRLLVPQSRTALAFLTRFDQLSAILKHSLSLISAREVVERSPVLLGVRFRHASLG